MSTTNKVNADEDNGSKTPAPSSEPVAPTASSATPAASRSRRWSATSLKMRWRTGSTTCTTSSPRSPAARSTQARCAQRPSNRSKRCVHSPRSSASTLTQSDERILVTELDNANSEKGANSQRTALRS